MCAVISLHFNSKHIAYGGALKLVEFVSRRLEQTLQMSEYSRVMNDARTSEKTQMSVDTLCSFLVTRWGGHCGIEAYSLGPYFSALTLFVGSFDP